LFQKQNIATDEEQHLDEYRLCHGRTEYSSEE
jgi:hypothetical protein